MPTNLSDKEWKQRDDARTLAEAEKIKTDPARSKGAQVAAKKMLKEQQQETSAIAKIASGKTKSNIKSGKPAKTSSSRKK